MTSDSALRRYFRNIAGQPIGRRSSKTETRHAAADLSSLNVHAFDRRLSTPGLRESWRGAVILALAAHRAQRPCTGFSIYS
jgi:hypothetical protein